MREIEKKIDIFRWGLSIFTVFALMINLNLTEKELNDFERVINSFYSFDILSILAVPILYSYYEKASKWKSKVCCSKCDYVCCIVLGVLFAFFVIMGYSFDKTDSWNLVISNNLIQSLKAFIKFCGYSILFFYTINGLYYLIEEKEVFALYKSANKYIGILLKRPFMISFGLLILIYLPYMIFSYPAIIMPDTTSQIIQGYNELEICSPGYIKNRMLSENVYINNHHPVVHTIWIHVCLELGKQIFNSYNVGIFICAIIQMLGMLAVIALVIKELVKLKLDYKFVVAILIYFMISPRIQSYMFLIVKDVPFTIFLMLFILEMFHLIIQKGNTILLFFYAIGVVLLRNDGKYLIIISLLSAIILNKYIRKKITICLACIVIFCIMFFNVLLPIFSITSGSRREMLSIPFQQIARYIRDTSEPLSEYEIEVVSAVLDYSSIDKVYEPELSDNVKSTFMETATNEELKEFLVVWGKLLLKHPSHYIQATMNNYYYYFYPGTELASYYTYSYSTTNMNTVNERCREIGLNLFYPLELFEERMWYESIREGVAKLPLISLLMVPAIYSWFFILLVFWCMKKHNKNAVLVTIPLLVQLLICLAGPCNGTYFRYLYPIVVCLPITIIASLYLTKYKNIE